MIFAAVNQSFLLLNFDGFKKYEGCIICILFQISWQLQTQIVKNPL